MSERSHRSEVWSAAQMILKQSEVAERGNVACIEVSTGKVVAGAVGTGLVPIGNFAETKTATGADGSVRVKLYREVRLDWFGNDGTNPVAASDVGSNCYVAGPSTVRSLATGASVAGKVWGVDAIKGVAVQMVAT